MFLADKVEKTDELSMHSTPSVASFDQPAAATSLLLLVVGLVSCGGESPSATRALLELERLTFVPTASSRLEGFSGPYADVSIERSLVVDRFEFTREDWLHYDPEGARASAQTFAGSLLVGLDAAARDLPAFLSYEEARALAERRGMRLMSAREWLHVAVGGRSQVFPYGGKNPQKSRANTLELGYGGPASVGTFEGGKSRRFDCYDLLGNVWEWVADGVPGFTDDPKIDLLEEAEHAGFASVMGGAYDTLSRRTFGGSSLRFHAMLLDHRTVSPAIGTRMCAEAERYLWESSARWGEGPEARARVQAVGTRWAGLVGRSQLQPLLDELSAREGAAMGLTWLAEGVRREAGAGRDE